MGWFNKKKDEGKPEANPMTLPELPRLPEFPKLEEEPGLEKPHQLPSFPANSLGNKFSQDTIKEAVTGKKEEEEVFDADEFGSFDEDQMMRKPLGKPVVQEMTPQERFGKGPVKTKKAEPVFIRIDKFEESLKLFGKTKTQIAEIEKMLKDIKQIKTKEEEELGFWEKEMLSIKSQVEKVDRDVFSKIE